MFASQQQTKWCTIADVTMDVEKKIVMKRVLQMV